MYAIQKQILTSMVKFHSPSWYKIYLGDELSQSQQHEFTDCTTSSWIIDFGQLKPPSIPDQLRCCRLFASMFSSRF